jgi:hypothetical protein
VNLKLNPGKCKFFASKTKVLGYIISGECIEIDKNKIDKILLRTAPRNAKDVQIFMGAMSQHRKFAKIAKPLYDFYCAKIKNSFGVRSNNKLLLY